MKKIINLFLVFLVTILLMSCDKHEVRTITFLGFKVAEYQVLVDENKNDIKDGYYYEFHESGKVSESGSYIMDKKVGQWQKFYNDGTLGEESHYVDGKREGLFVDYNKSGKVIIRGNFKGDKRDGVWEYALKNDTAMIRYTYQNGLRTELLGTWNTIKKYSEGIKSISFDNNGHCIVTRNNDKVIEGESKMLDTNDNGDDDSIELPIGTYKISKISEDDFEIYLNDGKYIPFLGWKQTIIKAKKVK